MTDSQESQNPTDVTQMHFEQALQQFSRPRQLLADYADYCSPIINCESYLQCCPTSGSYGNGQCYPVCNQKWGEQCSASKVCGPGLKCCIGTCVYSSTYSADKCLTPQQQLDILIKQVESSIRIESRQVQYYQRELNNLQLAGSSYTTSQVQSKRLELQQAQTKLEQEQLRLKYLQQIQTDQYWAYRPDNTEDLGLTPEYYRTGDYRKPVDVYDRRFNDKLAAGLASTSLNTQESTRRSKDKGLPVGAIIGIVVSAVCILLLCCLFVRCITRRPKYQNPTGGRRGSQVPQTEFQTQQSTNQYGRSPQQKPNFETVYNQQTPELKYSNMITRQTPLQNSNLQQDATQGSIFESSQNIVDQ